MSREAIFWLFLAYVTGFVVTYLWSHERRYERGFYVACLTSVLWPLVFIRHLPRSLWEVFR